MTAGIQPCPESIRRGVGQRVAAAGGLLVGVVEGAGDVELAGVGVVEVAVQIQLAAVPVADLVQLSNLLAGPAGDGAAEEETPFQRFGIRTANKARGHSPADRERVRRYEPATSKTRIGPHSAGRSRQIPESNSGGRVS